MVLLTCITYVFFHPGLVFGKQMTAQISVSANKSESAADHESHCGNSRMYNYSKNHSNSPQSSHDEKFIMDQRQKYYNPYFYQQNFLNTTPTRTLHLKHIRIPHIIQN